MSAGSGGYTVLDAAPTVEHIMPQKLSREWQNALGPLCHQVHTGFLNSFGNLTLVNSRLLGKPADLRFAASLSDIFQVARSMFSHRSG
jgi:Protein of unknown function (DUF1524)